MSLEKPLESSRGWDARAHPTVLERIYEDFHDDEIFARESLTVLDKRGSLRSMEFGPAQQKLHRLIAKLRKQRRPVRIIVLKARQVWISTYVAARFWRDTTHRPGQHTLVLAHDLKTAANVFDYYYRFHANYKPFGGVIGLPGLLSDRKDALEYANESWIKIQTASNANVGRSFTLRRVHFSEYAFYCDNARALMASVMDAVPDDPDTEAIVESTANGIGNEFHLMWQRAGAGESEWVPFFFGWHEHPEYVREVSGAFDLTETERHLQRAHQLTLQQLAWRRWKIQNDLNGDEALFRQEFPSCPEEAFLASGRPRFSLDAIAKMPAIRDGLEGGLEMQELAGRRKLIFLPRERGELTIYRKPETHRQYVIGADSAEGIDVNDGKGSADPDYAVGQVLDRDTGEQVAHLRARLTPSEFGRQLYLLGIYYCWAQQVLEANGPGLATIDALLRHGYPADLLYHRVRTPDQDPAERADLVGFKTTPVTRPQLISLLDEAIRTMSVLVHHPNTLSELRTFVIKANGRAEHQRGCHDDEVIALGLGMVGIEQMPRKKPIAESPGSVSRKLNNYLRKRDREDERGERVRVF